MITPGINTMFKSPKPIDLRIVRVERVVARHFGILESDLTNKHHHIEPKYICCFLLYRLNRISLYDLSVHFNIDRESLQTEIKSIAQQIATSTQYAKKINAITQKIMSS